MEIEIIRPLFKKNHIEDTLMIINRYINEWDNNEQKSLYRNIEKIHIENINLNICYFGNYFTRKDKKFILESLMIFIKDFIAKQNDKDIRKKITVLFNKKLDYHCYLSLFYISETFTPHHDVMITLFKKHYCGTSIHHNFTSYCCERDDKFVYNAQRAIKITQEYQYRLNKKCINLNHYLIR